MWLLGYFIIFSNIGVVVVCLVWLCGSWSGLVVFVFSVVVVLYIGIIGLVYVLVLCLFW